MRKFSNWLKQNPMLKLVSLVIAFVIWLAVVNISNPEVNDYVSVELEVVNPEELTNVDQMYSLDTRNVRVSYNVRTRYRNQINSSDFRAYVDLKDYSITGAVPVYVEPDPEISSLISNVESNPMVVHVSTEDMQEKRFDVNVRYIGSQADGYALGETELSQDYVYVNGPVSEVGKISSVGIEVDITEATGEVRGTAGIVFYDANGHAIEMDNRMELSDEEIGYVQQVYRIKSLSISADSVGDPAEGYVFEGVETSPSFISVYGPEEILESYSGIELPDSLINISGATRNVTLSIDVAPYIPEGLMLAEPSSQVTAIARIRRAAAPTAAPQESETSGEMAELSSEADSETQAQHGESIGHTAGQHQTTASGENTGMETQPSHEGSTEAQTLPAETAQPADGAL